MLKLLCSVFFVTNNNKPKFISAQLRIQQLQLQLQLHLSSVVWCGLAWTGLPCPDLYWPGLGFKLAVTDLTWSGWV